MQKGKFSLVQLRVQEDSNCQNLKAKKFIQVEYSESFWDLVSVRGSNRLNVNSSKERKRERVTGRHSLEDGNDTKDDGGVNDNGKMH